MRNAERLGRECRAARSSRRDGAGWGNGRRSLIARKVADEGRNARTGFGELVLENSDLALQAVDLGDLLCDLCAEIGGLRSGDESFGSGGDSFDAVVSRIPPGRRGADDADGLQVVFRVVMK